LDRRSRPHHPKGQSWASSVGVRPLVKKHQTNGAQDRSLHPRPGAVSVACALAAVDVKDFACHEGHPFEVEDRVDVPIQKKQ
jgi:hypothetical protein